MEWIVVRTYGNGKFMNKIYPIWFEYLSQAERMCKELNRVDADESDVWVAVPIAKYIGSV